MPMEQRLVCQIPRPHCVCLFLVYVKDKLHVSPLPANIDDMKDRITAAVNTVDHDMRRCIWEEFSFWFDVVSAAGNSHIEHFKTQNKTGMYVQQTCSSKSFVMFSFLTYNMMI